MQESRLKSFISGCIIAAILVLLVLVFTGCCSSRCQKVVYEPVEVEVPVPVSMPDLPLPEPVDCGNVPVDTGDQGAWRNAAEWLVGCLNAMLLKIEEYDHIIRSHNDSN